MNKRKIKKSFISIPGLYKGEKVFDHIGYIYLNQKHRKWAAMNLFFNACHVLNSCFYFQDLNKAKNFLASNMLNNESHFFFQERASNYLIDSIKVVASMEWYLKGILIFNGYLVHKFNKKECPELKKLGNIENVPIKISNFKDVYGYSFCGVKGYRYLADHKKFYLHGVSESTIGINNLLNKKEYRNFFRIPDEILIYINEKKRVRNKIHFKSGFGMGTSIETINADRIFLEFCNKEIIDRYNKMAKNDDLFKFHEVNPINIEF